MTPATLEDRRNTLRDLEAELENDLRPELERLESKAVEAKASGEDERAEQLRSEAAEVDERVRLQERAIRRLRREIEEAEKEATTEEARDRLSTLKRKIGGTVGEIGRRLELAEDARRELEKHVAWIAKARRKLVRLKAEIEALDALTGEEVPRPDTRETPPLGNRHTGVGSRFTQVVSTSFPINPTPPQTPLSFDRGVRQIHDAETPEQLRDAADDVLTGADWPDESRELLEDLVELRAEQLAADAEPEAAA